MNSKWISVLDPWPEYKLGLPGFISTDGNDTTSFLLLNQINLKTLNFPRIIKLWIAAATEDQWIVTSGRNSSQNESTDNLKLVKTY